jgi:hypothetical protein
MHSFHVHALSPSGYRRTVLWAVLCCLTIVAGASAFARASHNFAAALTDKPDLAIYLLLPEEQIGQSTLLREQETERDYLAETKDGPKLVKLKKGEKEWYVSHVENLHE